MKRKVIVKPRADQQQQQQPLLAIEMSPRSNDGTGGSPAGSARRGSGGIRRRRRSGAEQGKSIGELQVSSLMARVEEEWARAAVAEAASLSNMTLAPLAIEADSQAAVNGDAGGGALGGEAGQRLEAAVRLLNGQADQLAQAVRQLDCEAAVARRDVGNIQENLATIQSTATCLGDKVAKLQASVVIIERQAHATLAVSLGDGGSAFAPMSVNKNKTDISRGFL